MTETENNTQFDALLAYLKRSRGFDFSGYKRPSLMRRVSKRVEAVGVESYADYLDYLQVRPEEFAHLFDTILINVTKFFRDDETWQYLQSEVIPRILAVKKPDPSIRVWCAGVASGEEAYTVAMALAEAMGEDAFRARVKIYATDLDDSALNEGRLASYTAKQVEEIPPKLLEKYFEQTGPRYTFRKDLRRAVIFGRHDLLQDAPISRVDLLISRNALMYFNANAQSKILLNFHFAINKEGFLFLGKSELLLSHTNIFTPFDLKRRIFTKVDKINLRDRILSVVHSDSDGVKAITNNTRIREAAFDTGPLAQIVIDLNNQLVLANQQARAVFGLTPKDLGRPLQDLEISFRPVELRSRIEQAYVDRRLVSLKEVEWRRGANPAHYLDVLVIPLISATGNLTGASIIFTEVTSNRRLRDELQQSRQELETVHEELQTTVEELETTNEELQSTNEELETLNEELQSTNEELETMNEELHSTNFELETINEEMRQRTGQLNEVNSFLESILSSLRISVIVLDTDLKIQIWNAHSEEMWGLRPEEVEGQYFFSLDIGLNAESLKQSLHACLAGENQYLELKSAAINRRGKSIQCKVVCTPLANKGEAIRGVILLVEEREDESVKIEQASKKEGPDGEQPGQ